MHRFLSDETFRTRYWWPAIGLLALLAYCYALGSQYIPNIGDEAPYFQITRLTANSGHWLPLKGAEGLENTKPPLLFWQGIVSSHWGEYWTAIRLRLPIVIYTFLSAWLTFALAIHISANRETGYIAALLFLGFSSTFQHGRPFLTNMPETFFTLLVFYLFIRFRDRPGVSWLWPALGVIVGVVSLYRSFAVIVPIIFALAWYSWWCRRWRMVEAIRLDAWKPVVVLLLALGVFSLWPWLDPDPGLIFQNFLLKENVGKLGHGNYFAGLFSGPYPVYRIWLGPIANAGPLVFPMLFLAGVSFRQRKHLSGNEKGLWIIVFSYLIVFTLPSQRQENYVLAIMPILAVLLALRWRSIDARWFYLFSAPLVLVLTVFTLLMYAIARGDPGIGQYTVGHVFVILAGAVLLALSFVYARHAAYLFFPVVFLAYLGFAGVLAPFDGPVGNYSAQTLAALKGKTVYVPTDFRAKYERHRFVIPGSDIEGYAADDIPERSRLLNRGEVVIVRLSRLQPVPERYLVLGRRLLVRSRLSDKELFNVLFRQNTDVLVQQEVIVRLKSTA